MTVSGSTQPSIEVNMLNSASLNVETIELPLTAGSGTDELTFSKAGAPTNPAVKLLILPNSITVPSDVTIRSTRFSDVQADVRHRRITLDIP